MLATTKKGYATMAEYYSKVKNFAEEMSSSGQVLEDEDSDEEIYNSLVSSIVTRVESISPSKLFQMLSYELHLEKQSTSGYSSANATTRGRGGSGSGHGHGRGRGTGRGSSLDSPHGSYTNNQHHSGPPKDQAGGQNKPRCLVCTKPGHTANICWYKFEEYFIADTCFAAVASTCNIADPNWYLDSGTTDHITGELKKLTMHERYHGHD
jgi:hypothetical protein